MTLEEMYQQATIAQNAIAAIVNDGDAQFFILTVLDGVHYGRLSRADEALTGIREALETVLKLNEDDSNGQ